MPSSLGFIGTLRDSTPLPLRRLSRRAKQWLRNQRYRRMSPKDVFTEIYTQRIWGSAADTSLFSGPGSDPEAAGPYAAFVRGFIARRGIHSVVDLGCGDFRVGALIAPACEHYFGVDIVEAVIEQDRHRCGSDTVQFACMDITRDRLPDGELCLIREVFQHISNEQIQAVLAGIKRYRYALITDVQPSDAAGYRINKDRPQGASSRVLHKALLRLDQAPFNVAGVTQVFETDAANHSMFSGFKLRTFLIRP